MREYKATPKDEELKAFVFKNFGALDGLPMEDVEKILGMLFATLMSQLPREELEMRLAHFVAQVIKNVDESPWDGLEHSSKIN